MRGSNNCQYKRWASHVMVEPSEIQNLPSKIQKQVMQQYIYTAD
jgi:hypothetical protein